MSRKVRVADEIWLAVASLHQQYAEREDFTISEIMQQAEKSNVCGVTPLRSSLQVHAYLHCVANKPPNPGRYRMLFETKPGFRRLYRPSDIYHPGRKGAKDRPARVDLPESLHASLDWYEEEFVLSDVDSAHDPLLALRGFGREIWSGEDADQYVLSLRAGWK